MRMIIKRSSTYARIMPPVALLVSIYGSASIGKYLIDVR